MFPEQTLLGSNVGAEEIVGATVGAWVPAVEMSWMISQEGQVSSIPWISSWPENYAT